MSTLCEFIPQIIFLNGLFGYLCLLIVFKWLSAPGSVASIADLYHVMIYMFLSPGNVTEVMYPGMAQVQVGWARAYPASSLTRTHAHAHDTFTPTTVCVCGGGGTVSYAWGVQLVSSLEVGLRFDLWAPSKVSI